MKSVLKPGWNFTAAVVLLLMAASMGMATELGEAEASCPGSSWPWAGHSLVVNVPAHIASDPVTQTVGMALALAFVPADLIGQAVRGSRPAQDRLIPPFAHAGLCGGVLLGHGVALAVGAPFWILEEAFWDLPRRAFSGNAPKPAEVPAPVKPSGNGGL